MAVEYGCRVWLSNMAVPRQAGTVYRIALLRTWQTEVEGGRFIGDAKAASKRGAENCPIGKPPKVGGQDHNFQREACRLFYYYP
jgi:hypothetical protein